LWTNGIPSRRIARTGQIVGAAAAHSRQGSCFELTAPVCWRWTTSERGGTFPRMTHVLLNRLTAKPSQRRRVVESLLESGKLFDDNPACLLYLVSESTDDPNLVWVVDLWTSQEAHAEALKAPELRPYVEQAMSPLEDTPEQIEVGYRSPGLT
jgi:quinol monooxygenase YgiN